MAPVSCRAGEARGAYILAQESERMMEEQAEPLFFGGSLSRLPLSGGRRTAPGSRANTRQESIREVMPRQRTWGRAGRTVRSSAVKATTARCPR